MAFTRVPLKICWLIVSRSMAWEMALRTSGVRPWSAVGLTPIIWMTPVSRSALRSGRSVLYLSSISAEVGMAVIRSMLPAWRSLYAASVSW